MLRPGVLEGVRVVVAGGGAGVRSRCADLGAQAVALEADLLDEAAVAAAIGGLGRIDVLVCAGGDLFAAAGGGLAGLRHAVDASWNAVRAVVNAGWTGDEPGGKVVLVAPAHGEHASAVGAALENTARTTSVEWARFGIRVSAVRPGPHATPDQVDELVAVLASPAGDYVSGTAISPGTLSLA
ncbi:SDR family oxidoreductase [Conexibacter sp. SYSU D00693]|uniref:SDR family oxidoreductase n=1 Tax=Conexibacter sp. SYSU D00693 TaxID=2812560 RepID=UPI00196A24A4|nr:SDR family oxidoreductase [Conexibacter sp. SYSU D00693]